MKSRNPNYCLYGTPDEAGTKLPVVESGSETLIPALLTASYIKEKKISLFEGDCLNIMPRIGDKSIDLILCDLPYGITRNKWDVVVPFADLWLEYNRIIKDNGAIVLFGNQPFTSKLILSNMKNFRYSLVWEKNKFSDFLNAGRKPLKIHEDIVLFYKKQPTYNPQYWYSTPYERWNTQEAVDKQTNYGSHKQNRVKSEGRRLPTTVLKFNRVERPKHPTQKPVDLLEWLIRSYSNEGDTVLDNCMGVGSTGLASKNTNRPFIGIELDKNYFNEAQDMLLPERKRSKSIISFEANPYGSEASLSSFKVAKPVLDS